MPDPVTPQWTLGLLAESPYPWPGWLLMAAALLLAFRPQQRELALHLAVASWYVSLLAGVHGLFLGLCSSGCGGPNLRLEFLLFVMHFLPLVAVTPVVLCLAAESVREILSGPAVSLGIALIQTLTFAIGYLMFLITPFGGLPSLSLLLEHLR